MKAVSRYIALWDVSVAFVIAAFTLLFWSSNPLYRPFDELTDFQPFLAGLIIGAIVASVIGMIMGKESERRSRLLPIACSITLLAGVLCMPLPWFGFAVLPISLLAGILTGCGLLGTLITYCVSLARQPMGKSMLTLTSALLLSALIWAAFNGTTSSTVNFVQITGLCLAGVVPLVLRPTSSPEAPLSSVATSEPVRGSAREGFRYAWAAVLALAYNTFSVGLTFWLLGDSLQIDSIVIHKSIIYTCIFVGMLVVALTGFKVKRNVILILAHFALLGGAALVLGGMYLVDFFAYSNVNVLAGVPYYGTALFYFVGFSMLFWVARYLSKNPLRFISSCLLITVITLTFGLLVYLVLGDTFGPVSNAFLAVFAILLIISAVREVYGQLSRVQNDDNTSKSIHRPDDKPLSQDILGRVVISVSFAEHFSLSPRETEIISLLAQGYSAKYITNELYVSYETIRTHIKRIYSKTGVHSSDELLVCIREFEKPVAEEQQPTSMPG
jgi:DNA-binding CsgD family transcriptional regulator